MTMHVDRAVDDQPRLGLVIPKRLARRAVTRNLVKRHARALFGTHLGVLGGQSSGDWVVRLCRTFDVQRFGSAASPALHAVVGSELRQLLSIGLPSARPQAPSGHTS
jgi:ribonuclease P protein component